MAADSGAIDPWAIQPRERARYEEHFRSLNPVNGILTGNQVKGYFFQSQLPADVLGQIWALADVDSDGRLDINEFSIACKLITLRLRKFPVPTTLPPSLKALTMQSPVLSSQNVIPAVSQPVVPQTTAVPPQIPPQPIIPPQSILPPQTGIPQQPIMPSQPIMPPAPLIPTQPVLPQPMVMQPPLIPPQPLIATQPLVPAAPVIPQQPVLPSEPAAPMIPRPSLTGLNSIPSGITQPPVGNFVLPQSTPPAIPPQPQVPVTVAPAIPEPPKTLERRTSIESSSSALTSPVEWGIPHQSKLKYTQLFNTHDRTRTGFLSAVQARNILMQTRLPQANLAQIWALSDTDADGRLSCEEFVLAQHLCDMAREGRPLPTTLPPDLVPPTMRRKRGSSFSLPEDKVDVVTSPPFSNTTFEDKRKENFDKGQAELDRRRAALLEIQRKEKEERERKEREEEERREQLRLEQEARRQAELQKQRELEQQQEELRKKAQEQREAARKEAERLKLQEWERARTLELETQRQREQEAVLRLKAKNQNLAIELSTLTNKVKELSSKISETRSGVSAVKTTIDGMRSTRDTHMGEMTMLKTKLKEQNQRLLLVTQEKAKLEAKNKAASAADTAASEQARLAYTNKQITIKNLGEKVEEMQEEIKSKTDDVENNNQQLNDLKNQLKDIVQNCETLYEKYAEKRDAVLQLKVATTGNWGTTTSSWETPAADSWGTAANDAWESAPAQDSFGTSESAIKTEETHRKYRALYEFASRNPDELSFMPGDIIMVPLAQNAEPGWLMGELRGASGWFPESYVEPADGAITTAPIPPPEKQPLEGILEVPEVADVKVGDGMSELHISVYAYQAVEAGDLSFEANERITVIKKDGDWWTGVIGDRTGIFPSNYVQKAEDFDSQLPPAEPSPTAVGEPMPAPVSAAVSPAPDDDVFAPASEIKIEDRSPIPTTGSACVSGRETPADVERIKPATPDFSAITAAQTKMGKKGEIATVIAPYQASSSEQLSLARGQLVCIRKKTTTGWWEGELQAKGRKKQVGWFPASYVKIMASRRLSQTTPDFEAELNAQKVIAMFPYKAQNEDELSFEKDDVINVLSRDDAAWWKGEFKGVTGLFPSNYVMPVDNQSQVLSPDEKLRQDAILELIESERAYTNDMAVVRQVFEKPLIRSGLVTREQVGKIFLNWKEILRGHHNFLKRLDEQKNENNGVFQCVGDILCDNLPRMGAYVRFCSCQLSAGAFLQELTDTSEAFKELCRQCQKDPRTQGLPLSTFLIKPMQRITKYPLLISKILEHTPMSHPDHCLLKEAQRRADELCSQVNEGVRERENSEWLEWLQSHVILDGLEERLVFNSVTKHLGPRKLLHHGYLSKAKSSRGEMMCFLLNDFLILAQPLGGKAVLNGHTLSKYSNLTFKLYKKPLLTSEISIQRTPDTNEKLFTLTFPKGQCALMASSSSDKAQWLKHLNFAIEKAKAPGKKFDNIVSKVIDKRPIGRLLVEVVEAVNLDSRNVVYELSLGSVILTTPPASPPFKWNHSMQFLVRDIKRETISLCLKVHNEYAPDDVLDRTEISLIEIHTKTKSSGQPIIRMISLKQFGNAQAHIKFDIQFFTLQN